MKKLLKLGALALWAITNLNYPANALAQGTAFIYEGRLNTTNGPANGIYDMTFAPFATSVNGTPLVTLVTNSAIGVTNGLFTTLIDFGPGVFIGGDRWLEIAVRTNGVGNFTNLAPREQITPTPYAIYAESAGVSTSVSNAAVTATSLNTLSAPTSGQVLSYTGSTLSWVTPTPNGGLTLPYSGSASSSGSLFTLTNTGSGPASVFFGNVGIGTTSPAGKLHVYGNSAAGPHVPSIAAMLASGDGYNNRFMSVYGDQSIYLSMWQAGYGEVSTYDWSTGTALPLIFNSNGGNVGIGTTSPQNQLEVQLNNISSSQSTPTSAVKGIFSPSGSYGALAYTITNPPIIIPIAKQSRSKIQPPGYNTSTLTYGVYGTGANGDYAGWFDGPVNMNGATTISTATSQPLMKLTQQTSGNWCGLNLANSTFNNWEMDVTSGNTPSLYFYANTTFMFGCGPTGNFGIGTTTPNALLTVNGTASKPGGGSWSTYSDARLKDIGTSFTPGLQALTLLKPVYYHYKASNALKLPSTNQYVGVIAQQVQPIIPEAVTEGKDGYLSVNNDPIIWTMVNAIKELKVENDDLKKRLDRLEKKN